MSSTLNVMAASSAATAIGVGAAAAETAAAAGASASANGAAELADAASLYATVTLMDARGATINFLDEALQFEQTDEFKGETPKFLKGLQYEALKRKEGKLRER
jgi:hypothetical protein